MEKRFSGRNVVITGGTSGIGLALAEAFTAEGARVAVCARGHVGLQRVKKALPDVLTIPCDVTSAEEVAAMLVIIRREFGTVDIFVNNAGRLIERDFANVSTSPDELAQELNLNFVAPILLTNAVLRLFSDVSPSVVFITSGFALVSPTRAPTYGAAKAGLHAFVAGLRRQMNGKVHVLEVLPPTVDTPATAYRNVRKISAESVAIATLDALDRQSDDLHLDIVRLLPLLLRLAPKLMGRIVGNSA